jgi:hypothetical protein
MKFWPVATFEQHHPIVERFVKYLKMSVCSLAENRQISELSENLTSCKASLSGDFMSLFPTHPDFGNSAEEFHPHETLYTPMKLLSSLSSLI